MDDEPAVRQFFEKLLADEGHEVETAGNGHDALEMINNKRYNLILLDIKLPGMSGIELHTRIREIDELLVKRVIIITGDVMTPDTRNFLERTKVSYISKPFDAEQVKKDVNRTVFNKTDVGEYS